ncbi:hypothetical protein [Dactylosporangium sp. CA-092794]|uniref:hypothetical protein n=1 Tax=Dactylosporangium sp. CA-092794 TaxID=3239929 RepID=UPI003D8D4EF1
MDTRLSAARDNHPAQRRATNTLTEPEAVAADPADDTAPLTVIVHPQDFRLPDVLRQIEAGKIVLVMPQHDGRD